MSYTLVEKQQFLAKFDTPIAKEIADDLISLQKRSIELRELAREFNDMQDGHTIMDMLHANVNWNKLSTVEMIFNAIKDVSGKDLRKAQQRVKMKKDDAWYYYMLGGLYKTYLTRHFNDAELSKMINRNRTMAIYYMNKHNDLYELEDEYTQQYDKVNRAFIKRLRARLKGRVPHELQQISA